MQLGAPEATAARLERSAQKIVAFIFQRRRIAARANLQQKNLSRKLPRAAAPPVPRRRLSRRAHFISEQPRGAREAAALSLVGRLALIPTSRSSLVRYMAIAASEVMGPAEAVVLLRANLWKRLCAGTSNQLPVSRCGWRYLHFLAHAEAAIRFLVSALGSTGFPRGGGLYPPPRRSAFRFFPSCLVSRHSQV